MSDEKTRKGKGRRKPGLVLVVRMENVIMKVTRTEVEARYVHDACAYLDTAVNRLAKERDVHIVLCSASNALEVEADALRHDLRDYAFSKFIERYLPAVPDEEVGDACTEIAKANTGAYFAVIVQDKIIEFRPDIEEHLVKIPKEDERYFGAGDDIDRLYAIAIMGRKAFRCFEVNTERTYERSKCMYEIVSQHQSMLRLLEQLEAATANKAFKTLDDNIEDKTIVGKIAPVLRTMFEDSRKKTTEMFESLKKAVDDQYAAIEFAYGGGDHDHESDDSNDDNNHD